MARHTQYFFVLKVLLFSHTLLALSAALSAQEQFQHDVATEIITMKQHMATQQQQIMAQQQQMTTMQHELKIQKLHLMEKMTAQQQHISGQQQQITGLQQQVNSQKQEMTEQTRHMAEEKQKIAGQQQQLVVQQQNIMAVQQQMESQKHLLTEQTRQLAGQKEQLMGQQQQIATQQQSQKHLLTEQTRQLAGQKEQLMGQQQQIATQQQQHITALQQQMKTQKHLLTEQTQHLTEQLTAQQQQIIELQTTTPVDKQMTRRLLDDDIVTDVGRLEQQMAAVLATQQKQGLLVATNAHLMHNLSPGPNQRIIYDDVSMNHGNAYSTVHGTFTAPYDGTYVFSVSACSSSNHYIDLTLMHNAIDVKSILAGDPVNSACASGTTMLDLHTGDTVWVRHHASDGDFIETGYKRAVSFTGFLLHAS